MDFGGLGVYGTIQCSVESPEEASVESSWTPHGEESVFL